MKRFFLILLLATLCATGYGQTIKTLGYNTTNGQVVANTGTNVLKFTNEDVAFTKITVGDPEDGAVVIDNISIEAAFWKYDGVARISVEEFDLRDGQENIRLKWGDNTSGVDVDLLRTAGPIEFTGDNAATNAATTRTNLGLGATWLTNDNVTNFRAAIGLGATNDVTFRNVSVIENDIKLNTIMEDEGVSVFIKRGTNEDLGLLNLGFTNNTIEVFVPIGFNNNITNAAITRTNLGIPLAALTETSNVTMMRALAGSTNTNEPFSGSVVVDTNTLVFTNGILLEVTTP